MLVVAARVERIARKVEVVLVATDEILGRGRDLHEVGPIPGAAKRHGGLAEEEIDVCRDERLAVAALLALLDDPNDRRVTLGERLLVDIVGARRRDRDRCEPKRDDECDPASARHRRILCLRADVPGR